MIKALIGMLKWKRRLRKAKNMPAYTDEWWDEMIDALEFLPKDQREGMMAGIKQMASAM